MRRLWKILAASIAATILVLGLGGSPAFAADKVQIGFYGGADCCYFGDVLWNEDPDEEGPGDSVRACDYMSDGWGIKGWVYDEYGVLLRTVTTQGHAASYCTSWNSGNLPEGMPVYIVGCRIKGTTTEYCDSGLFRA
ncbi:hypothetical protein [Phytohabitans aurantiacus]|jgi:hypothetical protein|uniref:Secreted protein n=1 Tax=Phytohabitans aurantiacus TaxID=3016789 RepID=A0ABQ5RAK8_9ACTN|nr:hypothetical protein [Phytohabitans aurantiacus]GLI03433.1 hypothetical protein Pa4123_87110 [Phytohabitans aurantiacus]